MGTAIFFAANAEAAGIFGGFGLAQAAAGAKAIVLCYLTNEIDTHPVIWFPIPNKLPEQQNRTRRRIIGVGDLGVLKS